MSGIPGAGFTFPGEYSDPDLGAPLDVAKVPSGAFETTTPFELTQQLGRALAYGQAEYGTIDEYGRVLEPPEPSEPPDVLNQKYGVADPTSPLHFTSPLPDSVAQGMYEAKQEELTRRLAAARRPPGLLAGLGTVGADFAANALDPLNVAATFIPVVGEARYGMWLDQAGSALARTAIRAGVGAAQGAAGQVPLSALRYGLTKQEQGDYSATDALLDIAYGAGLGGILHAAGGMLGERLTPAQETAAGLTEPAQTEPALRTAIAQLADDRPVDVTPITEGAPIGAALSAVDRPASPEEIDLLTAAEQADRFHGGDPLPEPPAIEGAGEAQALQRGVPSPVEALPPEPERLIQFLKRQGGLKDASGELRQIFDRNMPVGLASRGGLDLDEATLRAWQEGYLPGSERPEINDLLNALGEDNRGVPRYAEQDADAAAAYHDALARNSEIDRLSQELGIETRGLTREQFWDQAADQLSQGDAASAADEMAKGWLDEFSAAEARAREWLGEHGGRDASAPELYNTGSPRSLDDLEREHAEQGGSAEGLGERAGGVGEPGPAAGDQGAVQAGGGQGGRGIEPAGRTGAAGGPSTAGEPGGGTGELMPEQVAALRADPRIMPDELAELDAADQAVGRAQSLRRGFQQAAACIARGFGVA